MTKIEISGKGKQPQTLNFGYDGENNEMLGATSQYLTRGGRPWLPVMGEFHFSRFRPQFWREEIEKMKAGGIQIVATYVFWIHHEEREGEWDFSGQRDLRRFLEICKECSLPVLLRIGP